MNHRRDAQWHSLFDALPERIRVTAKKTFKLLCDDPSHRALRFKKMRSRHKGRDCFEVSITKKYRAVAYVDGDTYYWFWIGTHNDFDRKFS